MLRSSQDKIESENTYRGRLSDSGLGRASYASFLRIAHGTFSIRRCLPSAATNSGADVRLGAAKETSVDTNTLLIILIVLVVFGGGGFYGRGRWW